MYAMLLAHMKVSKLVGLNMMIPMIMTSDQ